jgi:hypothetical protein
MPQWRVHLFKQAIPHDIVLVMTTVDDIAESVAKLAPGELARFCAWFEAFEEARFDHEIERDAQAGRLDGLGEQALADFRQGRTRDI